MIASADFSAWSATRSPGRTPSATSRPATCAAPASRCRPARSRGSRPARCRSDLVHTTTPRDPWARGAAGRRSPGSQEGLRRLDQGCPPARIRLARVARRAVRTIDPRRAPPRDHRQTIIGRVTGDRFVALAHAGSRAARDGLQHRDRLVGRDALHREEIGILPHDLPHLAPRCPRDQRANESSLETILARRELREGVEVRRRVGHHGGRRWRESCALREQSGQPLK